MIDSPCCTAKGKINTKTKQQLIVEINIGKMCQAKSIRIVDINNNNLIDQEIKWFIRLHNLKDTAFQFIKQRIQTQIANRRQQIYRYSHKKHSHNCKCSQKIHQFQEKEKIMTQILSFNQSPSTKSPKRVSLSPNKASPSAHHVPQPKKKPYHLQIKISSKNVNESKSKENSEFKLYEMTNNQSFFNSKFSFPSLGQIEKINFADETFSDAFGSNKVKDSCQFTNMTEYQSKQQRKINSKEVLIRSQTKDNLIKPLETSFKKNHLNSIVLKHTPIKRLSFSPNNQAISVNKIRLSTKERKMAIMTPRSKNVNELLPKQQVYHGLNHESLQKFINQQKKALRSEYNWNLRKVISDEPLFTQKCISQTFQKVLRQLFSKLTQKNPPEVQQLHTRYVSYQHLQKQQLHFMGILFQKINYKQLNNLNYDNFRSNSLKYCWRQLEELIEQKQYKLSKDKDKGKYLTKQFTY